MDPSKATDKDNLWCTFCKKLRHAINKCWKLHGKPTKGGQQKGQAYVANGQQVPYVVNNQQVVEEKAPEQAELMELNWEEIEKLRNLLGILKRGRGQVLQS